MKYVRCDSHCKYPAYDKNEVDELLKKKTGKSDYSIITGTITLTANTDENVADNYMMVTTKEIDYPDGFNDSNCVVVAFGVKTSANTGYHFGNLPDTLISAGLFTGLLPGKIWLNEGKLRVDMWNPSTTEKSIDYKIVLMKAE